MSAQQLYTVMDTPVGPLLLGGNADGVLTRVHFLRDNEAAPAGCPDDSAAFAEAVRQLDAYFAGALTAFELPIHLEGSPFQLAVWEQLRLIPYGETISYGELARRLGDTGAARAVGMANNANPIAIVIPCHRVIGANGKLVGFGGGVDVKQRLLALERGERWLGF